MLAKVVARWAGIEFVVVPYKESKDVFILSSIEDIQVGVEHAQCFDQPCSMRTRPVGAQHHLGRLSTLAAAAPAHPSQFRPQTRGRTSPTHSPQSALEDSLVAMSTILASRYVGGIRAEVERVERQLTTFSDALDQWVQVRPR